MRVHLVDATYELFRHYFAQPSRRAPDGREVAATYGVLQSMIFMLKSEGATHVACATDHVIRSFRNDLYAGYKTEAGIAPDLWAQFPLLEDALRALGMVVWAMVDQEADDALAAGAARYAPQAEQVLICSPDKDLAQCVRGDKVIMYDRRNRKLHDEASVRARYGIGPEAIPDWLALVGDSADGYPGIPGFGEKTASALLGAHGTIEQIPDEASAWKAKVRGADRLARELAARRDEAKLYKVLATLRTDAEIADDVEALRWKGPTPELAPLCERLGFPEVAVKAADLAR